jgi:hypothetical protein
MVSVSQTVGINASRQRATQFRPQRSETMLLTMLRCSTEQRRWEAAFTSLSRVGWRERGFSVSKPQGQAMATASTAVKNGSQAKK